MPFQFITLYFNSLGLSSVALLRGNIKYRSIQARKGCDTHPLSHSFYFHTSVWSGQRGRNGSFISDPGTENGSEKACAFETYHSRFKDSFRDRKDLL